MDEPDTPSDSRSKARQPRRNADYRWTVPKVAAFLRALSESGSVAEAARSVGMSRQAAYRLRARLDGENSRQPSKMRDAAASPRRPRCVPIARRRIRGPSRLGKVLAWTRSIISARRARRRKARGKITILSPKLRFSSQGYSCGSKVTRPPEGFVRFLITRLSQAPHERKPPRDRPEAACNVQ